MGFMNRGFAAQRLVPDALRCPCIASQHMLSHQAGSGWIRLDQAGSGWIAQSDAKVPPCTAGRSHASSTDCMAMLHLHSSI
jgi:hypothetical protein